VREQPSTVTYFGLKIYVVVNNSVAAFGDVGGVWLANHVLCIMKNAV